MVQSEEEPQRVWFEAWISKCEDDILKLTGMPEGSVERHWARFDFEGEPFKARYFLFGDQSKPVLLMTHGYASKSLSHYLLFKPLAQHFRVIFFDNYGWGANSRLKATESRGLESAAKSDEVMLAWLERFFEAIDHLLPQKFNVYAHS